MDQALAGADAKLRGAEKTASRHDATSEEVDNAYTSVGDAINLATKAFLRHRGRPTGDGSFAVTETEELSAAIALARGYLDAVRQAT